MSFRSSYTRHFLVKIVLLIETTVGVMAYFSTVECPANIEHEILSSEIWSPLQQKHCTLHFACSDLLLNHEQLIYPREGFYREDFPDFGCESLGKDSECEIKLKVTVVDDPAAHEAPQITCPISSNPEDRVLWAHPNNCSLFYKCDWSEPVLFECPEDLHFNTDLQICDWPWQAGCDDTWTRCPRPGPFCPAKHSRPIYLPHPHLCDQFYQCSWGQAHLQNCPTGLHFNPNLKVCDWPHNAKCNICR